MDVNGLFYFNSNWNALLLFGLANFVLAFIILTVLWYFSEKQKNGTFIDLFWSLSFALIACSYCVVGHAPLARKALLLLAILPWSLRLFFYLYGRIMSKPHDEDKRYAEFRKSWGKSAHFFMFLMFQFQGFLVVFLSLPIVAIAINKQEIIHIAEFVGAVICLIGFLGESVADAQLKHFKSVETDTKKVCDSGLWYYSRHPNYFFEWVVWIGIFVFSTTTSYGLSFIYCPLLMLFLLLQISGVKLSEEHSLKSRRENYKTYQETTSAFVPWFKLSKK